MALAELKSDLSWYGTTSPGPYKTPPSRTDTKFKGTDDVPYVSTGGYEFQGIALISPVQRFAGDSFLIDDVTFSDRGLASRKAQFGTGTKFPIGPSGQIHSFDQVRTGFTVSAKYGEVYSNQSKKGLADTYTVNSPIDDMYNKFNLRDDATPNSYIKHPLILRGIQRQGKTDNQRWGLDVGPGMSGAFDIPRGGIITAANRTLIDVARHAKFLASPRGIGFLAKQVGYQLMNPKAETRLYNPLSLGSLAPIVHINRQFGTDEDGIMYGLVSKLAGDKIGYGTQAPSWGIQGSTLHTDLKEELFGSVNSLGHSHFIGSEILTLSSKFGGPGSVLGIGGTSIKRWEDTSIYAQHNVEREFQLGYGYEHYINRINHYANPYQNTRGEQTTFTILDIDNNKGSKTKSIGRSAEKPGHDPYGLLTHKSLKSLASKKQTRLDGSRTLFDGGGKSTPPDPLEDGNIVHDYKRMAYGAIPKREVGIKKILDFRETVQSQAIGGVQRWGEDKRIDVLDASIDKSLIKFKFGTINFKAYIGSLNDSFAPSWSGMADQGRADPRYLYNGFERTMTLDFLVPIMTQADRIPIWNKLERLAQLTYPVYGDEGFHGSSVQVTIGDLFVKKQMIITDLGYSWDTESPWEIDSGHQAPMYTNVSLSFTVLGYKPSSVSAVYANSLTMTPGQIAEAAERRRKAAAAAKKAAEEKAAQDIIDEAERLRKWEEERAKGGLIKQGLDAVGDVIDDVVDGVKNVIKNLTSGGANK